MKRKANQLFYLTVIIILSLLPDSQATAQPLTILHTFTAANPTYNTNADGAHPYATLFLSGNTLYGTTAYGSTNGAGTVFAINTDGTGFTNIYNPIFPTSLVPYAPVISSGNMIFGTTLNGGPQQRGNVFRVNTDGSGVTTLYNFTNASGANPFGGVILSGSTLYGTAASGGNGNGSVFAINTNGAGFTNLHVFAFLNNSTNSDGIHPYAGLLLSGNTLYGTAREGGAFGKGTVYALRTDGTGFTNLHSFAALDSGTQTTNNEGAFPDAGLALSGNTLYGTADAGGRWGKGTVFSLNTNGTGFTNLHNFTPLQNPDSISSGTNSDGAAPRAPMVLSGSTLYGTTLAGGRWGSGALFAINTDGSGFKNWYSFSPKSDGSSTATNSDGASLFAGLVISGNALYGTAYGGGSFGSGTVFKFQLPGPPPALNIASVGNQTVLFWPAWASNYILQSTTNLASPNWVNATDAVTVIAVTVSNTVPARFFRLQQP
jgi:uncharacterized repeat protein (TIGR03803 family)